MKVAWYYYEQGMTQQEIGKRLGFSRTKIVRLLATARERGIVQIKLVGSYKSCLEKEESLKAKYTLLDAIIIPAGRDFQSTKTSVGKACALYLEKTLQEGDIFGVTWGTTLYEAGRFLEMRRKLHITVVQLMGGLNTSDAFNPQEIVRQTSTRGALLFEAVVAPGKAAVELMAENQAKDYEPGLQGQETQQCADDFAPVQSPFPQRLPGQS